MNNYYLCPRILWAAMMSVVRQVTNHQCSRCCHCCRCRRGRSLRHPRRPKSLNSFESFDCSDARTTTNHMDAMWGLQPIIWKRCNDCSHSVCEKKRKWLNSGLSLRFGIVWGVKMRIGRSALGEDLCMYRWIYYDQAPRYVGLEFNKPMSVCVCVWLGSNLKTVCTRTNRRRRRHQGHELV